MLKENKSQQAVINCIDGPVMVIACPGSGKTTTLLNRIHNMAEQGIPEQNILMVTFTRNAAEEMKTRYINQYGEESRVTFKTIHSLCFSILRQSGLYQASDIISEDEEREFIYNQLCSGRNYIEDSYDIVKNIINEISSIKNNYTPLENYEASSCETEIFLSIYENYQNMLKDNHKIDYDEMMLEAEYILKNKKGLLEAYQEKFRYIQCDEYQDTNPIQKNILYMLADKYKNICVVGDDDQSIYGFRGAKPGIMFDFQKDFPGCKVFDISTNYRSGQKIVDIASELIKKNNKRFDKQFISDRGRNGFAGDYSYMVFNNKTEEMDFVVKMIKELHLNDAEYSEIAILFRTNNLAQEPMEALLKHNIPFRSTEKVKSVYDKWIFMLLKSYLCLSLGKWKQKYINDVIAKPNKYLKISAFKDCPFTEEDMLNKLSYMDDESKPSWQIERAKEDIKKIFRVFEPGRFKEDSPPIELIKALEYLGIDEAIKERAKKRHEEVEETRMELAALSFDAARFRTVKEWLQYAKKDREKIAKINELRTSKDGVNVMTMHSSKGCEWEHVFVIEANQNIIPHRNCLGTDEEIEEERRLLYVALTRAKDGLYVLSSGVPSPFMEEIMMERKKRKIASTKVKKPEDGDIFVSIKYGIGVFQGWERQNIMLIKFVQTIRKFEFPDAIEQGFLKPM